MIEALLAGEKKNFYQLGFWVVMPNHVHILLMPRVSLTWIVSGIKVASATGANRILGRTGKFWCRDYFDRWMRNSADIARVTRYIENNPVKAGFCKEPGDYRFSSSSAKQRGW